MTKPAGKRTCLYTTAQLDDILNDMVAQSLKFIANKDVVLLGILRRGVPLSEMIAAKLKKNYNITNITLLNLQIKRYSDTLELIYPKTLLTEDPKHAELDLSGKTVIIVDDVLYQGYSLLKAMDYLLTKNPAEIRVMVLVDREAGMLPIKADIVGTRLHIAPPDVIECNIPPYEEEFKIELLQLSND